MADFINTVDVLGDDALTDSIITRKITEYCDNTVVTIGERAFYKCTALTKLDSPSATSIGESAFEECGALASVNVPSATSIGSSAFNACKKLITVTFPAVTSIGRIAFVNCTALKTVDFSALNSFGDYVFNVCSALNTLILRNTEKVASLASAGVFDSTPIKAGTGYIYVPRTLVDSYKAATNWSTYAARFRALEDYTVDGTTTGELDPTKI